MRRCVSAKRSMSGHQQNARQIPTRGRQTGRDDCSMGSGRRLATSAGACGASLTFKTHRQIIFKMTMSGCPLAGFSVVVDADGGDVGLVVECVCDRRRAVRVAADPEAKLRRIGSDKRVPRDRRSKLPGSSPSIRMRPYLGPDGLEAGALGVRRRRADLEAFAAVASRSAASFSAASFSNRSARRRAVFSASARRAGALASVSELTFFVVRNCSSASRRLASPGRGSKRICVAFSL